MAANDPGLGRDGGGGPGGAAAADGQNHGEFPFWNLPSTFSPWSHDAGDSGRNPGTFHETITSPQLSHVSSTSSRSSSRGRRQPVRTTSLARLPEEAVFSTDTPEVTAGAPPTSILSNWIGSQQEQQQRHRPFAVNLGQMDNTNSNNMDEPPSAAFASSSTSTPAEPQPPQPPQPTRTTRFREMLQRSLTGRGDRSAAAASYDPIMGEGSHGGIGESSSNNANIANIAMNEFDSKEFGAFGDDRGKLRRSSEEDSSSSDDDEREIDEDDAHFLKLYGQPPVDCHAKRDPTIRRRSWLYVTLLALSIYSTFMSGLWLIVAIYQPRYGRGISSTDNEGRVVIAPSTASLLSTLLAKTIELSFVTVFVAFLGQVLTRRAFVRRARGVTLAEMTMRNWVIQPGSLLTYWEGLPHAAPTLMGVLTLLSTIGALLYTTASDAMVSPKLKYDEWHHLDMKSLVRASYANPYYVGDSCTTPIDKDLDPLSHDSSCLDVRFSGQSYLNLYNFMGEWATIHDNGSVSDPGNMAKRPNARHNLYENTTLVSSWIDVDQSDPAAKAAEFNGRVINNVTLAMPHPGVYTAATDRVNGILQPGELSRVGEYAVKASVMSPAVNVLCANMSPEEMAPLIYTEWPDAITEPADGGVPGKLTGASNWTNAVPVAGPDEWLNRTSFDDVFRWGEEYQRRPPVFQLLPYEFNIITNTSTTNLESIYLLGKAANTSTPDYTLCEIRSFAATTCSTHLAVSGISGGHMTADCSPKENPESYEAKVLDHEPVISTSSADWRNLAIQWGLSMNLDSGVDTGNASNARVLTHLALASAASPLPTNLPTMAEALAVLASSTLVIGATDSTFKHYWGWKDTILPAPGVYQSFPAMVTEQQYASAHESGWQACFYAVLALVFVLNVLCLLHHLIAGRKGLVADHTEPQNLFALAVNSPPSGVMRGSCGQGPEPGQMVVPYRVRCAEGFGHYYFEEVSSLGGGGGVLASGIGFGGSGGGGGGGELRMRRGQQELQQQGLYPGEASTSASAATTPTAVATPTTATDTEYPVGRKSTAASNRGSRVGLLRRQGTDMTTSTSASTTMTTSGEDLGLAKVGSRNSSKGKSSYQKLSSSRAGYWL